MFVFIEIYCVLFKMCVFYFGNAVFLLGSASGLESILLSILDVCSSFLKLFMDSWVWLCTITTLLFLCVGDVS